MGLLSGLAKAGLAKKAIDEAKKPENQRKIKRLLSKNKGGRGGRPA
jgi:hypothetical protein